MPQSNAQESSCCRYVDINWVCHVRVAKIRVQVFYSYRCLVALGEALLLQTKVSIKLKLRFMLDSLSIDSLVLFP
jgi:hypothetical protein